MNFRFWKYFEGWGITGTIYRVPGILLSLLYIFLVILGFLAFGALIYALL